MAQDILAWALAVIVAVTGIWVYRIENGSGNKKQEGQKEQEVQEVQEEQEGN